MSLYTQVVPNPAAGADWSWPVPGKYIYDVTGITATLTTGIGASTNVPDASGHGNNGTIQIHSGPVKNIQPMGPWLNVMDPTFHMHLRMDHIAECWVVRKPTTDGHVTSLEAYDASGEMIVQFFGKRKEGKVERDDWREILANLPRPDSVAA